MLRGVAVDNLLLYTMVNELQGKIFAAYQYAILYRALGDEVSYLKEFCFEYELIKNDRKSLMYQFAQN